MTAELSDEQLLEEYQKVLDAVEQDRKTVAEFLAKFFEMLDTCVM